MNIYAKESCGCCIVSLNFKDLKNAETAFLNTGLSSNATITDDEGVIHKDIDTFYGFSVDSDDMDSRGLNYLLNGV